MNKPMEDAADMKSDKKMPFKGKGKKTKKPSMVMAAGGAKNAPAIAAFMATVGKKKPLPPKGKKK